MRTPGPSARLVQLQARWHTATCTVTRPGAGEPVFDPNTGGYTDPAPVAVYAGACLVTPTGGERAVDFGEGPVVLRSYDVQIEDTSVAFRVGDDVTITDSRDPLAVGMTLDVLDVPKSEHVTVRRLTCEEVL